MGTILIQTITVPKLLSLVMDRSNSDFCKAFNKWRLNVIATQKACLENLLCAQQAVGHRGVTE